MLEPEGTVEIKFRMKELVKSMARLDSKYISIQESLSKPGLTPEEREKLNDKSREREVQLAPIYHQVRKMITKQN